METQTDKQTNRQTDKRTNKQTNNKSTEDLTIKHKDERNGNAMKKKRNKPGNTDLLPP